MAPPPAAAPPGLSFAPLPSDSLSVAVSIIPTYPSPPVVLASSSDADSSVSSPLHLALSSALSSGPVPPTRYFPPALPSCVLTGGSSVTLFLPLISVAIIYFASAAPLAAPALLRFSPPPSLVLPPAPLPPHPPSLGILRTPAPPACLLPQPCPPILPVRTKILATGRAGVRHAGRLRAGQRRTGSSLEGPSPWWGTESVIPCSYTILNSSTQCTFGRLCGTCTPWLTGPWWCRLITGCSCSTA